MSYLKETSNRKNGGRPLYVKISPVWKSVRQKVEAEWTTFGCVYKGKVGSSIVTVV